MRLAEFPDPDALEVERRQREPDPPQAYPVGPTAWWMADRDRQARQAEQARRREREEQKVTQPKRRAPLVVVPRRQEQPDPSRWWDRAACKGEPLERFFLPEETTPPERKRIYAANARLCGSCPVRTECLEDALQHTNADDHGFRGGVPQRQRRDMRAARGGAA